MLQCVLTGGAQEAYSSLSAEDSSSFVKIKSAVLKAYELVPEAYRQRFRSWESRTGQTYMEFARDVTGHFKRWLDALEVTTFGHLCDLVVLEQFKNMLPGYIATYVSERKCVTAAGVAALADEYLLLHKGSFRERAITRERSWRAGAPKLEAVSRGNVDTNCNYCHEEGHWKADCPLLHFRNKKVLSKVNPVAAAAPVVTDCVSELLTVQRSLNRMSWQLMPLLLEMGLCHW